MMTIPMMTLVMVTLVMMTMKVILMINLDDVNEPELHKQPWWQVPAKSGCCRNGESGLAPRPCPSSPDHDNDHNDDNYDDDDDNDEDDEDYDAVMIKMLIT